MSTEQKKIKVLIIRFSSFGDIVQCMSILRPLKKKYPHAEIHWITRSDFAGVLKMSDQIDRTWKLDKREGLVGLIRLKEALKAERFDVIYDAHCNIRSKILCWYLAPIYSRFIVGWGATFIRRGKDRLKRIMLFKLKKNFFEWPYRGMVSFLSPLKKIGVEYDGDHFIAGNFDDAIEKKLDKLFASLPFQTTELPTIALAPSAAWEMKRWPTEYWKRLILLCPEYNFILLGGPTDTFLSEIEEIAPHRVINLAGKTSLLESCALIKRMTAVVSGDTGMLHVTDILGVKGIAIVGPTAFGFPTSNRIETMEVELDCRPCTKDGRGKCVQETYQKCLVEISPERVAKKLEEIIS
ncbi:MAG: glycosyltransferase family 9 protein [Bacteriovoracaceae bacterium]|nr:glycosyltransferase family 9 protein [Bacteriovoracaceae bacterium]